MTIATINPTMKEEIKSYTEMSLEEVGQILEKTQQAFLSWRESDFSKRCELMKRCAEILRTRKEEFAQLMTEEMGKPIIQARSEVEKCAWVCDFYATHAKDYLTNEMIETDAKKSYISFKPLGIILAVMPWNFPFWQVFRFLAPALMAGNAGVLKHASNVPGCALAIEEITKEAGFPPDLFRTLLIGSKDVNTVIEHPCVKAVTLTGSTPAGKAVAAKAGSVLKKTVLELGGSDPYVILEDADLEMAVSACVTSRLNNAGQSCIAAKRFIVVEPIRSEFEKLFVEKMKAKKMGDPKKMKIQTLAPWRATICEINCTPKFNKV